MQGQKLASVPLVALENVARAGPVKLVLHTAQLSFSRPPYWGELLLALLLVAGCIMMLATRQKTNKISGLRKRGDEYL
jgi:hypothetical protein